MGCDIHFYVDVQQEDGSWKSADKLFDQGEGYLTTYEPGPGWKSHAFYDGRNYDLFAILADVRNGRGFAGVKTGQGFNPIFEPRGVPDDCCPEYSKIVESWGVDGHSHSYATVEELMQYDWTQTTVKQGLVTAKEFLRWKLDGAPNAWCGGSSAELITNEQMENRLLEAHGVKVLDWRVFHAEKDELFGGPMTSVQWEIPYYQAGKAFLSETLPKLWRLGSPSKVRCLYFFDN